MEFSTEFVALRDRYVQSLDKAFVTVENAEVAGRMAAAFSQFEVKSEKRLLGLMPTGASSHAHEYRLLFAAPELSAAALADWWTYIQQAEQTLVQPDETHDFSILSVILVTEQADRDIQKQVRRLCAEHQFAGGKLGWSSVRLAVIDLAAHKVYANRMGGPLKNILRTIV